MIELKQALDSLNIPVAYRRFTNYTKTPFITYNYINNNDLYADNINYKKLDNVEVNLYSDYKDLELEDKIENMLNSLGHVYSKEEIWIEEEKLININYNFTIRK